METTELRPAPFSADYPTEPQNHYACWLDVMGKRNSVTRSLPTSADHVCRPHVAALDALDGHQGKPPRLYPAMAGIYITSERNGPLLYFLSAVLRRLVEAFLREHHRQLRFLVRGAVAYGPLVHGRDIDAKAANAIRDPLATGSPCLSGCPWCRPTVARA